MSSPVNAPTTILPPITVSSTGNPSLFEQPNNSGIIKGGRRKSQRRKNKRTKKRTSSKRKSVKKTFLGKWLAIGK